MLFTEFVEFHAKARPDSLMLMQDEQRLSFGEAISKGRGIAAWLRASGVAKGDRVAILGENSIDHFLLLIGVSYIGAVMVPLNYRLAAPELADIAADSGTKLLLVSDPAMADLKQAMQPLLSANTQLVDALGAAPADDIYCESESDDVLIQLYTSGTTGRPKGVQGTHRNIETLVVSSWQSYQSKPGVGATDLLVAPLFHIGGLGSALVPIMAGGTVLLHRQFDPMKIVDDIEAHDVNSLFLVPVMIQAVLATVPNIRERNFSSLKSMSYGASPISPSLLADAIDVFGCRFMQVYGMTETTGAVVVLMPEDHYVALDGKPELLQSCGRAMAGTEVRICNSNGEQVPNGETGEIVIRSGANTPGYWQRPEETAKAVKNGWVYTGDAGVMDDQGYIYIRDRMKDMVVTGGENVYPVEVEKVIAGHPAVLEAAIIGIPDDKYGEALLAVCVFNEGATQFTAEEMVDYCRDKIAGYKIPRQLKVLDALPRNPSGKILKTVLREPYWRDQARQV